MQTKFSYNVSIDLPQGKVGETYLKQNKILVHRYIETYTPVMLFVGINYNYLVSAHT